MSLCAVFIVRVFAINKLLVAISVGGIWASFPPILLFFFFTYLLPVCTIGDGFLEKLPDMLSSAYGTLFTFHPGISNTLLAKLQDIFIPVVFFVGGLVIVVKQIQRKNGSHYKFDNNSGYPAICNLTYFYGSEFVHVVMQ